MVVSWEWERTISKSYPPLPSGFSGLRVRCLGLGGLLTPFLKQSRPIYFPDTLIKIPSPTRPLVVLLVCVVFFAWAGAQAVVHVADPEAAALVLSQVSCFLGVKR